MPGNIATVNCKMIYDPTSVAPATMIGTPEGTWTPNGNEKVSINDVAILDESCQLTIPSMQIQDPTTFTASQVGSTVAPTVFKFTATSTKVTTNNKKVLCVGDMAQATVNFTGTIVSGPSTAPISKPYVIVIKIIDPGQTKVSAL